jgi:hypothetical protein
MSRRIRAASPDTRVGADALAGHRHLDQVRPVLARDLVHAPKSLSSLRASTTRGSSIQTMLKTLLVKSACFQGARKLNIKRCPGDPDPERSKG